MNQHNHNPQETMYTCPIHPEIRQEKPGLCPECGMSLVEARNKKQETINKHAGHSTQMFFRKFWVSLVLTIPVVLYADIVENIFKWSPPEFPGSGYLQLALGSVRGEGRRKISAGTLDRFIK